MVYDAMTTAYAERFSRVFAYIDNHLSEELTVDQLSRVANFSKYHFHRQFSQYVGIAVARYVQLMRLRRASYRLVFDPQVRVIDIALEARFESPESFARAFKNAFGQTPSQFRKEPAWQPWKEKYRFPIDERRRNMEVEIVDFEETKIAVLEHRGPHTLVNDSVRTFIAWRKQSGLSPVNSCRTFAIAYDDPETTDPDQFRFDICGSVSAPVPENLQGVINKVIPGGRYAVVRHFGSHDDIRTSAHSLYREWLPESGEEPGDFPMFFHYLNLMPETAEHELVTDIYLPLR